MNERLEKTRIKKSCSSKTIWRRVRALSEGRYQKTHKQSWWKHVTDLRKTGRRIRLRRKHIQDNKVLRMQRSKKQWSSLVRKRRTRSRHVHMKKKNDRRLSCPQIGGVFDRVDFCRRIRSECAVSLMKVFFLKSSDTSGSTKTSVCSTKSVVTSFTQVSSLATAAGVDINSDLNRKFSGHDERQQVQQQCGVVTGSQAVTRTTPEADVEASKCFGILGYAKWWQ